MRSVSFNGITTSVPSSLTRVDRSGNVQSNAPATGIVAFVGEGNGGIPVSEVDNIDDLYRATRESTARSLYRKGDLLEASLVAFNPASDSRINGRVSEIVYLQTNNSTASTVRIKNTYGTLIDLKATQYGPSDISYTVEAGTTQGKKFTFTKGTQTDVLDNVGGDDVLTLHWNPGAAPAYNFQYSGMTVATYAASLAVTGTATVPTTIGSRLRTDTGSFSLDSTSADDVGAVTVLGLVGTTPTIITVNAAGTANVPIGTFSNGVLAAIYDGVNAGDIHIRASGGINLTIAAGAICTGGRLGLNAYNEAGTLPAFTATQPSTIYLVSGSSVEAIVIPSTAAVSAASTTISHLDFICTSVVPAGQSVGVTATVRSVSYESVPLLGDVAGELASVGITATIGAESNSADNVSILDRTPVPVSITTAASFQANVYDAYATITGLVPYVNATVTSTGVGSFVDVAKTYLAGGSDGVSTTADWTKAFELLKQIECNYICVLSNASAHRDLLKAHMQYRSQFGPTKAYATVGVGGATGLPTIAEHRDAAVAMNSQFVGLFIEQPQITNSSGVLTYMPTWMMGVVRNACAASTPVATSMTRKYVNIRGVRRNATWNPTLNGNELVNYGACIVNQTRNRGFYFVRDITSVVTSDDDTLIDAGVVESINFLRDTIQRSVEDGLGENTRLTEDFIRTTCNDILEGARTRQEIEDFDPPAVFLEGSVFNVEIRIAPTRSTTFILTTIFPTLSAA